MARIPIKDHESVELYLQDIAFSEPFDRKEEIALARRIKKGDQDARERLAAANLRFVVSVASEFTGRGLPLAELISAGNLGLMNAIERFDATKGFKFISYAVWWIRQAIQSALSQQVRLVRLPISQVDLLSKISRASGVLHQSLGRYPEPSEIANTLGVSEETVQDTLLKARTVLSLDAPLSEDSGSLLEILADTTQEPPEQEASENLLRERVARVLKTLPDEREQQVLSLYFGLDGEESHTLEEIGERFGLTRERVRQIKEKALSRLRHPTRRTQLESLMDS
jgi:RNA polymerase primary sigma factor